ncbi:MAG: GIY-YIG nuclease family protein [Desulfobacterales bacterium]|nr:GIY-YIG nuclease family protein [Desulfobacterales bacterium]
MVYILRCSDGSFYTGVTNGLEKRLMGHGRGRLPNIPGPEDR